MAERGLDCLLATFSTAKWGEFQSDTRYLSHVGDGSCEAMAVFPLEGEVTCFVRAAGPDVEWELAAQDWVRDVRGAGGWLWSQAAVERIQELGLERGRIGVPGLGGILRAPEGSIPYTTFQRIREALPHAHFENATDLMQGVRIIKSPEEIAFLERATELAEYSISAMAQTARPGVREYEVYAAAVYASVSRGGDYPFMLRWRAGPFPERQAWKPTQRAFQAGDIIVNETDAKYGGYTSQVVHAIQVGGPPREDYLAMFELSRRAFQRVLEQMAPGVTYGELLRVFAESVQDTTYQPGAVLFIGRGVGEDEPMVGLRDTPQLLATPLRAGMVVTLKPPIRTAEGRMGVNVGDTVTVTESGARRLGKRSLEPIVTPG